MKLSSSPTHLTYCTNIHPGESWPAVFDNLATHVTALKHNLFPNQAFGIGLRLSDAASRELLQGDALLSFQRWLQAQDLYVFTLNGFPYGGFHNQVVKDKVYAPDWTQPKRLHYTLRLVEILAALLPPDMDGGISTLPLSYKPWWQGGTQNTFDSVFEQSTRQIVQVVAAMADVALQTGKVLHLDIEPEPDGLIENTTELINFFEQWLLPVGIAQLSSERGLSKAVAEDWLRTHVQVCYDTCHFAVAYEDPNEAIDRFLFSGIQIGKLQLSSALKVAIPADAAGRRAVGDRLSPFVESTYLHQVVARHANGKRQQYRDLKEALVDLDSTQAEEWRTHFHVPIFLDDYQSVQSTRAHLEAILNRLPTLKCRHLEIETYTWDVLPSHLQMTVQNSIQREYEWVLKTLSPFTSKPYAKNSCH